jgi:hypothetical protein
MTFARVALIKENLGTILRDAANATDETIARIQSSLNSDRQWVETFMVCGFDSDTGYCRAELRFNIDWVSHKVYISNGKGEVAVDVDEWKAGTSPLIRRAVDIFKEVVQSGSLRTEWRVVYVPEVYQNADLLAIVQRTLQTHTVPEAVWRRRKESLGHASLTHLEETSVELFFEAEDE